MQLLYSNNSINNQLIAGVDEAGRGALAGPVVATAVILENDIDITVLKDSKQLSEQKRNRIYRYLIKNCTYICTSIICHKEIDKHNILNATLNAFKNAVTGLQKKPDIVLIDGDKKPNLTGYNVETIVRGDQKVPCISAASIIAKVTRDNIINSYQDIVIPYSFSKHKGYGTQEHRNEIMNYGQSRIHRKNFKLKHTKKGKLGELIAKSYLLKHNYIILESNYYSLGGEVDIIALSTQQNLHFIEVKHYSVNNWLTGISAVTHAKKKKIKKAASDYLEKKTDKEYEIQFDIIIIESYQVKDHISHAF